MQSVWQELVTTVVHLLNQTAANHLFDDVVVRYGEDGRYYHTLQHIQQMLTDVAPLKCEVENWTAVQYAIWFHDVVYVPGANDNEERSAAYTCDALDKMGICQFTDQVEGMILATKLQAAAVTDPDTQILLDADLATLGSPPHKYRQYAQAIRHEFTFVPLPDYCQGRIKILSQFLQRPQIYYTERFYDKYESQARKNLLHEISQLNNQRGLA
ncbi:MAG: hypothetical protein GY796_07595 [Chloroflexi bacterium]|nr:hypothetical protein [Chloroflexota bacterium]